MASQQQHQQPQPQQQQQHRYPPPGAPQPHPQQQHQQQPYAYTTAARPHYQHQQQQMHQMQQQQQQGPPGQQQQQQQQNDAIGRKPTTLGRAPTRRMVPGANSIANASHNMQRGRTLIRPDRYQEPAPLLTGKSTQSQVWFDPWVFFSRAVTFWAPPPCLQACGKTDPSMQQAWREKIALCFLIASLGAFVAFITIGLGSVMCPPDQANNQQIYASYNDTLNSVNLLGISGWQFNVTHVKATDDIDFSNRIPGTDVTNYFQHGKQLVECADPVAQRFHAVQFDPCDKKAGYKGCPLGALLPATYAKLQIVNSTRLVGYDWQQLAAPALRNYFVIDGNVLNMDPYINAFPQPVPGDDMDALIRLVLTQPFAAGGRDATKYLFRTPELKAAVNCMVAKYRAGHIDKATPGCFVASVILYCSLAIVLSIVLARFLMALIFSWFISRKLARTPALPPPYPDDAAQKGAMMEMAPLPPANMAHVGNDLYTVMLITCYSENTEGIRATVESLSRTTYPDDRKLLFLIADGIITGSGETISTPEMCLSLVSFDPTRPDLADPEPQPYIAVANGQKMYNRAKVYAGHYVCQGHQVPMILIVKVGNPMEQDKPKAGNRGKRDSQLILMNFFSRVTYNDRMTPLDYDLFQKITHLMGVTPDLFELVLMVDADTKVEIHSLRLLVNSMINDNLIMGLCGETKIANKRSSWVTAIQVYEYFISHHMAKGFESVFGGVTCLPGCFSMYRLKARKGDGDWVPIITKPEIVQEYSQNTVDTLHQKNLLLLGEDRFLTTLMLRNFPYRKMVFTPQAVCKTIVPEEFKVLLSQRRRWINSTIHNLFELVLVRNLCGTFCFSMQFVIVMDLIGTLTLPVAIVLTAVLVINLAQITIDSFMVAVPLVLLIVVLFSPAFLILITTHKWVYLVWMLVYLLALPIWNFVLPVYSYWHFDDFSWGETRKITGGGDVKKDVHGAKDGDFDPTKVPLRRWEDYERKRIRALKRRERKLRELGPTHPNTPMSAGQSPTSTIVPGTPATPTNSQESDANNTTPTTVHYFDPSKEAPGKATSGYYPTFRPPEPAPGTPQPQLLPPQPQLPPQQQQIHQNGQNMQNMQSMQNQQPHGHHPRPPMINTRPPQMQQNQPPHARPMAPQPRPMHPAGQPRPMRPMQQPYQQRPPPPAHPRPHPAHPRPPYGPRPPPPRNQSSNGSVPPLHHPYAPSQSPQPRPARPPQ